MFDNYGNVLRAKRCVIGGRLGTLVQALDECDRVVGEKFTADQQPTIPTTLFGFDDWGGGN